VCDRETRRFNQAAANLSDEIVVIMLSTDLPYTQKNWCSAAGVDRVFTYSDNLNVEFGTQYGVLIKERRVLRRSIFVVNRANEVVYADYMPTLGDEPKYDEVLQAARDALEN
jgi:thiol peroxidase